MVNINKKEFVIFDVETTGLSPINGDRVIEFAAIKAKGYKEIDRFETLINPERNISFEAFLINGISDEMLLNAPCISQVATQITEFMGEACLVGHNIKFDIGFMNNEFSLIGCPAISNRQILDTIKMARSLYPGLDSYSLSSVAFSMGIEEGIAHRAMADVCMTFDVFKRLLKIAEKNNIGDINLLLGLYGIERTIRQTKQEKLKMAENAISNKINLQLLYQGASRGVTLREVVPKEIVGTGRTAMLRCFCNKRMAERSFIIDKILSIEKILNDKDDKQLYF